MEKEIKLENNGFLQLFIGVVLILSPLARIIFQLPISIFVFVLLAVAGIFWITGLFGDR